MEIRDWVFAADAPARGDVDGGGRRFFTACRFCFIGCVVYRLRSTVHRYYWQLELRGVKEAL